MNASANSPRDFHADLSADRLAFLEDIIRTARAKAFSVLNEYPDYNWSAGCFAYEMTMRTFAAKAKDVHWLGFVQHSNAYVLIIGDVPVRVKRKDRPTNAVLGTEEALLDRLGCQQFFDFDGQGLRLSECIVRLEFEVHDKGVGSCALRVWSREEREEKRVLYYEWPIAAEHEAVVATLPKRDAEVLPPADYDIGDEDEHEHDVG
jgi:hypothetical protein